MWLVWKMDGGTPVYKHATEGDARKEAERLVRIHGGQFVICQAVAVVEKNDVRWREIDEQFGLEIPF